MKKISKKKILCGLTILGLTFSMSSCDLFKKTPVIDHGDFSFNKEEKQKLPFAQQQNVTEVSSDYFSPYGGFINRLGFAPSIYAIESKFGDYKLEISSSFSKEHRDAMNEVVDYVNDVFSKMNRSIRITTSVCNEGKCSKEANVYVRGLNTMAKEEGHVEYKNNPASNLICEIAIKTEFESLVRFKNIFLHELSHTLDLDHIYTNESGIMSAYSQFDFSLEGSTEGWKYTPRELLSIFCDYGKFADINEIKTAKSFIDEQINDYYTYYIKKKFMDNFLSTADFETSLTDNQILAINTENNTFKHEFIINKNEVGKYYCKRTNKLDQTVTEFEGNVRVMKYEYNNKIINMLALDGVKTFNNRKQIDVIMPCWNYTFESTPQKIYDNVQYFEWYSSILGNCKDNTQEYLDELKSNSVVTPAPDLKN